MKFSRWFFIIMALFFIVTAVAGFVPDYKMMAAQHISVWWFAHVHGALLTLWLLVYLTQAILASNGRLSIHKKLGQFSVVLGAMVWISMGVVIFHAHIGYPPRPHIAWAVVVMLATIMNLFGIFFILGIWYRKNAAVHKRLLVLATLMLIAAGFNRVLFSHGVEPNLHWPFIAAITGPSKLGIPNPSGIFLYNDLLLLLLFIYDLITIRKIHRVTILSTAAIVIIHFILIVCWSRLP